MSHRDMLSFLDNALQHGRTCLKLVSLQASVTCSVTGRLVIPDMGRINGKEGAEVFSERKGNLFNILKNKVRSWQPRFDSPQAHSLYRHTAYMFLLYAMNTVFTEC